MERFKAVKKGDEDYLVCVAHVCISGSTMFEGEDIVKYDDLKELDPDVWCWSLARDQGITEIEVSGL